MSKIELNENERTIARDVLGYLNFSSGNRDVRFPAALNELYRALAKRGSTEIWRDVLDLLRDETTALEQTKEAFRDSRQARRILDSVEKAALAYREFHSETLFHQKNSFLFNSFFMARLCRLTAARDVFGDEETIVSDVVQQTNDFLGYRPIPVLEGEEKHEPNPHEWIGLTPLYLEDVGVAFGPYSELIEQTLTILRETPDDILREASFDPDKLRELALDPRAFDFDHPVNRRPNYSFGTWDDRCIDGSGFFRRFVLHQTTVDAIMSRVWETDDPKLRDEYRYEAAAVLAGTILMASGVCGGCVQAYDSTVTLAGLMQSIAAYRDEFYERLLARVPEPRQTRLRAEEARLFQPFGGARQYLNQTLAKRRADQAQRFSLARTYARMGYFEAAKRQAKIIETPSARLLSQIDSLVTEAHLATDAGKPEEGATRTPKIEELLRRGIACGAFPDPWFIIGFGGQFSVFQSSDSVVHDHRLDGLADLLNDIFDLYSRLQKEAAAKGLNDLRADLSDRMSELAGWWDQFGSEEVSNVESFSGQEVWESASMASTALAAWRQAGGAIGDVAFWRRHIERFRSPKAFVLLGEALLDRNDWTSTASLLIYWLDRSETIPLTEGDYSFNSIAFTWLEEVWTARPRNALQRRKTLDFSSNLTKSDYLRRWNLTKSFLDRVEANADEYWSIPKIELGPELFERKIEFQTDNPVLGDLARRLILSTKFVGRSKAGVPKLSIKSSFKDVVRGLSLETLPSAEEFEKFYRDNANVFPSYLTFRVFMQIVLNELRLSPERRRDYREKAFGGAKSISVSNPKYSPNSEDSEELSEEDDDNVRLNKAKNAAKKADSTDFSSQTHPNETAESENDRRKSELWDEMIRAFEGNEEIADVGDLIERLLDDFVDAKDDGETPNELPDATTFYEQDDEFDSDGLAPRPDEENEEDGAEKLDENDDAEEDDERGIDPLYRAAYDNMSFRDSADDGIDDETVDGKAPNYNDEGSDFEFAQETERVDERLSFIFSIAKFWKFAAGKSPLLRGGVQFAAEGVGEPKTASDAEETPDKNASDDSSPKSGVDSSLDDETLSDARLRLESWLKQAIDFERGLYELLDQTSRYRIPKPSGTAEALAEYDQLRGTKEILLDRVIWTIVEVEDAILFLKATLRDESVEPYEKPWKSKALETLGAMFRVDAKRVRRLWNDLIRRLEKETLLYIPTSRGGDAKAIVDCRRLQQVAMRLFEYAPRLGLFTETFRLLRCVQKMEQMRLSAPGSITEFDRLVGTATRGLTETLAESSKSWRIRPDDPNFSSNDEALVYYLEKTMDVLLATWLSHSQHIRISSVEAIATNSQWNALKEFIQEYGSDLFTQQFLSFRNIRAILQQGVVNYLSTLMGMYRENRDIEFGEKLTARLVDGTEDFEKATTLLGIALEAVAEYYSQYVDYNSITTQSDRGEKLYTFIDFLRVLSNYERISWNLKPVYWVHDALIRANCREAAALWKKNVKVKSAGLSQESLRNYQKLNEQYGIWLPSVYERLQERFVRPLDVAQMCGLVFDAITEARRGDETNPIFQELEQQVEEFARVPSGFGFDLPDWLNALQEEVVAARVDCKEECRKQEKQNDPFNPEPVFPIEKMTRAEVERQIIGALNRVSTK